MKYIYLTLAALTLGGCAQPGGMRPADYVNRDFPDMGTGYGTNPGYSISNGVTVWECTDAE